MAQRAALVSRKLPREFPGGNNAGATALNCFHCSLNETASKSEMLSPSEENEVNRYLSTCVGMAAKVKGLANHGFYDVAELLEFLRTQHLATYELVITHINTYGAWAEKERNAAFANRDRPPAQKVEFPEVTRLAKERDKARQALVKHLGLNELGISPVAP